MKNQLMNFFKQAKIHFDQAHTSEAYKQAPDYLYRLDIFNTLKDSQGEKLAATLSLKAKIEVNTFDQELSSCFCNNVVLPLLGMIDHIQQSHEMYKYLTKEEILNLTFENLTLTYNL